MFPLFLLVFSLMITNPAALAKRPAYPPAPQDQIVDDYFGTKVPDPYRGLESIDAPQVEAWIRQENALTDGVLSAIPERAAIRARYRYLVDYARSSAPFRAGPRWFYFYNTGLQNQPVLYVSDAEGGAGKPFLDPNELSSDGTIALGHFGFTRSGRLLAYSTQEAGEDWETWHVRDVARNEDLSDKLEWTKFTSPAWVGETGFYYQRYEAPEPGKPLAGRLRYQKVYFHRIGTPQSADALVYERAEDPDLNFGVHVSEDQRYAFLYASEGTEPRNELLYRKLTHTESGLNVEGPWQDIFPKRDARYDVIGNDGTTVYLHTTLDAPRGRIISIDLADLTQAPREIVAQQNESIESYSLLGNTFFVSYLHDAHSVIRTYDLRGVPIGQLPLPGFGTATPPQASYRFDPTAYFSYTSYTEPGTVYRYEVEPSRVSVWFAPRVAFDSSRYTTEQIFVTSRDGTRVPVFVSHRKDLVRDGKSPAILSGYGGFDISLTPAFSNSIALWLEMGGIYAVANLRGGGEFGEAWHQAGMLEHKQNVFDDFIAVAQGLEQAKFTSASRLAISGGSNGGLLVAATMLQRPDLFGAVICQVGVLDMLRYQHFTIGGAWVNEFGSAEATEAQFKTLYAYSPYHNIKPGVAYPPMLILTGDHDDRVYPAHSYKFGAALQQAQAGAAPVLLRVETRAGHGAGKPLDKQIDEVADEFAFLVKVLDFAPLL